MTHLRQLTQRTHDIRLRVQLTGFGVDLTAHDMLIHTRVTHYLHLIDRRRLAFVDTHLEINRVVLHVHLHRLHIEEQVSAVGIEFAHRIIIPRQTVIERLEVIHIAGFDTERSVQVLVRINGVAHPFHRTDIVLVAFADGHIHIHARRVFGIRYHAVRYNIRIAETVLVVFLDHRQLVFLIFGGDEFLGAEEVDDIVIVRFLHCLVDLPVRERLVTGDVYLTHFGLHFLIHPHEHLHVARVIRIGLLHNVHLGVVETFLR